MRHEGIEHLIKGSFTPDDEKYGMTRAFEVVGALVVAVRPGRCITIEVVDELIIIE